MARAIDVAKYLINLSRPNTTENITNLKLQKILYYAQGFSLALHKSPLFTEEIKAWAHGPVVPEVYHEYKGNKYKDIRSRYSIDEIIITPNEAALINEVWDVFKSYNGKALENLTHSEDPWIDARGNLPEFSPSDNPIPMKNIQEYFVREYIN